MQPWLAVLMIVFASFVLTALFVPPDPWIVAIPWLLIATLGVGSFYLGRWAERKQSLRSRAESFDSAAEIAHDRRR